MPSPCPECEGTGIVYTGEELRDRMRHDGHTCVRASEAELTKCHGYHAADCEACAKERRAAFAKAVKELDERRATK
jgi:hypothetical protein